MSRDPLARMDVDTRWAYHRKVRRLQAAHPEHWPIYWAAYLALLGEAWAKGSRTITLEDAWCPVLPCTIDEARDALRAAEIIDRQDRVPTASWREWHDPVAKRLQDRSDAALRAAHYRWHVGPFDVCPLCADVMRTHSNGHAPRPPRQPHPPVARGRARGVRSIDRDEEKRTEAIARAQATLDDPQASDDRREVARFQLRRFGVSA